RAAVEEGDAPLVTLERHLLRLHDRRDRAAVAQLLRLPGRALRLLQLRHQLLAALLEFLDGKQHALRLLARVAALRRQVALVVLELLALLGQFLGLLAQALGLGVDGLMVVAIPGEGVLLFAGQLLAAAGDLLEARVAGVGRRLGVAQCRRRGRWG